MSLEKRNKVGDSTCSRPPCVNGRHFADGPVAPVDHGSTKSAKRSSIWIAFPGVDDVFFAFDRRGNFTMLVSPERRYMSSWPLFTLQDLLLGWGQSNF